ncbi:hypothetical protein [Chryseobacterium sp. Mn2064]|uniref:hypothetical protein n=1 Tax=Chryseobacterium sp. Mn2064 TaxID=3395263 RepID=UPI003BC4FEFF
MKILLYVTFIVLYGFLLFKLPTLYSKRKVLIITGVGIIAGFMFLMIAYFVFLMYASQYDNSLRVYEKQFLNLCMGIISLFFFSFFVLFFVDTILENVLIRFHQANNSQNIDRNPIKFVINNVDNIKLGFKLIFFLGGFIIYYGVCFGAPK